jgi:archaemetzincin
MLSEPLRRAFSPDGFEPLLPPQEGEWLAEFRERGQTYDDYVAFRANRPDSDRNVLYFVPIGSWPSDALVSKKELREFCRAFFGLEVKILDPIAIDDLEVSQRQLNNAPVQLKSRDLLGELEEHVPKDAYALIGLTFFDLYPDDDWFFVFGEASLRKRVAIQSLARYDPAFYSDDMSIGVRKHLVRKRSFKVLSHEIGHMFGMEHCTHYRCVMNGSNSLYEVDTSSPHLCPVCLRKLHSATKFEPDQRYQELGRIYERGDLEGHAAWTEARAKHITGAQD